MQSNINTVLEKYDEFVSKNYKEKFGLNSSNRLNWGCEECGGEDAEEDIKNFISTSIQQLLAQRDEEIIKMLENTDVQMSVNGDVSQDEIAMAKFIYKAHINHIKKKLQTYEK